MPSYVLETLEPFSRYGNVWVELTRSEHQHGGAGWEFGTCLWSPSHNASGHDRYAKMRQPRKGDLVLHIYHDTWEDGKTESRLCGSSRVIAPYREVRDEPPSPGPWKGSPSYYRIDLEAYRQFPYPLSLVTLEEYYCHQIRDEIVRDDPLYYPFSTYGDGIRLAQGLYLTHSTELLYQLFREVLGLTIAAAINDDVMLDPHAMYVEGKRMEREQFFFARNPHLVQCAKDLYGCRCQVCYFNYEAIYGDLGRGYIECHHLNPLSERPEEEWTESIRTSLDEVAVVCANCHRMLHRRSPTLQLDELRTVLEGLDVRRNLA